MPDTPTAQQRAHKLAEGTLALPLTNAEAIELAKVYALLAISDAVTSFTKQTPPELHITEAQAEWARQAVLNANRERIDHELRHGDRVDAPRPDTITNAQLPPWIHLTEDPDTTPAHWPTYDH